MYLLPSVEVAEICATADLLSHGNVLQNFARNCECSPHALFSYALAAHAAREAATRTRMIA
jgi:hypothetical protein